MNTKCTPLLQTKVSSMYVLEKRQVNSGRDAGLKAKKWEGSAGRVYTSR